MKATRFSLHDPVWNKRITLVLVVLLATGFIISGMGKVAGIGIPPGYTRYSNYLHVLGYVTGMAELLLAAGLIVRMYRGIAIIGIYISLFITLALHLSGGLGMRLWSILFFAALNTALWLTRRISSQKPVAGTAGKN